MSIAAIIYIRSGKWKVNVYPGAKCDEASHFLLLVVKSMDMSVFLKAHTKKKHDSMQDGRSRIVYVVVIFFYIQLKRAGKLVPI